MRPVTLKALTLCLFTLIPTTLIAQETTVSRINNDVKVIEENLDSVIEIRFGEKIGAGFIIDESGFAVTNYHVVRGGTDRTMQVFLRDGEDKKRVGATIYKRIPSFDLAILKLDTPKTLKALRFGPGSDLKRGEKVLALGHPYGYGWSVTKGMIAGLRRTIKMPVDNVTLTNLIQTDALINPGNSGGPLLNVHGEVIGVNVALRKGAQGIAFALNADDVQRVLSRYLSAEKISGLNHGLYCTEKMVAKNQDTPTRQVVVVDEVSSSTPAAQAGLQEGDKIIKVGQRTVRNRFDVERSFWNVKKSTVSVTINRSGFELTLEVRVPTYVTSR